jgi:prolyl-tRNA synthetase
MPIFADAALEERKNLIAGANKDDYHLGNVTPGEDFSAKFADIRQVTMGDTDLKTGEPVDIVKTMEIGHIFKLGYKYSDAMGLRVLNEDGKEVTVIMGSYGIGVERVLSAAVELYNDKDGISMPASIAPFEVVVTPVNMSDAAQKETALKLYTALKASGVDVLLDDRDERPGVKFKDAELIGIPWRVTVGKKLAQGLLEVSERRTKQTTDVAVEEVTAFLKARLHG